MEGMKEGVESRREKGKGLEEERAQSERNKGESI